MLNFFKKDVYFKLNVERGWTVLKFFTPLDKWQNDLKDSICCMFSENLNFDDYVIASSNKHVEIDVHADLEDLMIDFLINRHGFVLHHQGEEIGGLSGYLYHKKLTERQILAFCKDFEKLKLT